MYMLYIHIVKNRHTRLQRLPLLPKIRLKLVLTRHNRSPSEPLIKINCKFFFTVSQVYPLYLACLCPMSKINPELSSMAPSISFGEDAGFQVAINNGSITTELHPPSGESSQNQASLFQQWPSQRVI